MTDDQSLIRMDPLSLAIALTALALATGVTADLMGAGDVGGVAIAAELVLVVGVMVVFPTLEKRRGMS